MLVCKKNLKNITQKIKKLLKYIIMKNSIEQTNIENNKQLIVFLESKLPDLPDRMKEN